MVGALAQDLEQVVDARSHTGILNQRRSRCRVGVPERLLSDAEGGEDEVEDVVGGGGAGEGVEAAEGFVEVEEEDLVGELGCDGGAGGFEAGEGGLDGGVLAQGGEGGGFGRGRGARGLDDGFAEGFEAVAGGGGGGDGEGSCEL